MLRSPLLKSGSCLSRGISPLKRSTRPTATSRASSAPSIRSSRLPIFSQRLQSRHYAVAVEETNKGVVSSFGSRYNLLSYEAEKKTMYRILVIPSCKVIPRIISTRCTCNGKEIPQVFMSHGRFTFGIWKTAICLCRGLSNLHQT